MHYLVKCIADFFTKKKHATQIYAPKIHPNKI